MRLEELVRRCTVKLSGAGMGSGTGFFIAPGYILTCEHVVRGAEEPIQVRWQQEEDFAKANVLQTFPDCDVAVLSFDPPRKDLPCVYFDEELPQIEDRLYLFGYGNSSEHGDPVIVQVEGMTGDVPSFIKYRLGGIKPGMSGAALVNCRTGKVCGMSKFTVDEYHPQGGGGVPVSTLMDCLSFNVIKAQRQFHERDRRWLKAQPLTARRLPTLLTPNEFEDRVEQAALTSHQGYFVGREIIRQQLLKYLDGANKTIILHGSGGLGKTRLLLALPNIIPQERVLWYIRNEAESVEEDIVSLDRNTQQIIIVDDAHRFRLLEQLREVIVNPKLAGKVTLLLTTRSIFKDSLIYQLGLPGDRVEQIEVKPLENQDIDQILQNSPHSITDQDIRHAIVRIAEGNPLIAGIAARLHKGGIDLINLTRDRVLTSYLDEIVKDLSEVERESNNSYQNYIHYLQILAALGTINLEEQELQSIIHEVIGISAIDEERIVSRLVEAGLVERYWKTLKIASEILADHILVKHFFDPKTKQADYQKQIIEPFFHLKPKEVLTNLAEAEVKGESSEAGLLFNQKLYELRQALKQGGNVFRLNLLQCLQDVAYLKPDDILLIVDSIVNGSELPPECRFGGLYKIGHEMVLSQAVEVLNYTIYRGGLQDSIKYLYELALYQPENNKYSNVREKATRALVEIAKFKPRKPYSVQLLILDMISNWLEQDFFTHVPLSLALIQPMLNIDLNHDEISPIQPRTIVICKGSLVIGEFVKQIRDRALEILYAAYQKVQDFQTRLQIVEVLCKATYYLNSKKQVSLQTREKLESDCAKIAHFFSEAVMPNAEFFILDRIAEWLWQAKSFHQYQALELDTLQQVLRNNKGYQLYHLLFCGYKWDCEGKRVDYQTAKQQKQQRINEYIEAISSAMLEQAIQELETVIKQAHSTEKFYTFDLNNLLRIFGKTHFNLAKKLIAQTIAKNLYLKQYIGFVLAGMRLNDHEIVRGYVRSWITQDNAVLWVAIAQSYRFIDWSQPQLEEEWNVLRQLVAKQLSSVDLTIFYPIQQLAPHKPDLAVELLKVLAARGDELMLHKVAETISLKIHNKNEWVVTFNNRQDFLEIIQNFERLPVLEYEAEMCLKRLADIAPMRVIDLIENRIKTEFKRRRYQAFSQFFSHIFDDIQSKPEYLDILRRVRDWMLKDNSLLRPKAPALLEGIALNLEGKLYSVLMEWVESRDAEKLEAVARILLEFNSGQRFYDLSREIIVRTQDEDVLSFIHTAICNTPGAITGFESNFTEQRIEEVLPWSKDNNVRVRAFANKVVRLSRRDLEREKAHERLEERSW